MLSHRSVTAAYTYNAPCARHQVLVEFVWSNSFSYLRSKTVSGVAINVDGAECMPTPRG